MRTSWVSHHEGHEGHEEFKGRGIDYEGASVETHGAFIQPPCDGSFPQRVLFLISFMLSMLFMVGIIAGVAD